MRYSLKQKAFGQNFLRDAGVIQKIVRTFNTEWISHGKPHVLEIGPGQGALTQPLLDVLQDGSSQSPEVLLIEKDQFLAKQLNVQFETHSNVRVLEADFLETSTQVWNSKTTAVLSNLPYSTSTLIFLTLTRVALLQKGIPFMLLMFQSEVAQKLRTRERDSSRSILSVLGQNVWEPSHLISVPPGAFSPPPDVNSEVVLFKRRPTAMVESTEGSLERSILWEKLVRLAFRQKRKMIRSTLKGEAPFISALEKSGVDGSARAESLDWPQWNALFKACLSLVTAFLVLIQSEVSSANIGDSFGFGSRASALGGATASWGADGFAAYSNPALLGFQNGRRIEFSYGTLFMTPQFETIQNVVTENTVTSDGVHTGNVATDYRDTFGQELGLVVRIAPEWANLTAGLVTYFPVDSVGTLDSGDAYLPEYVLYRARTQRPQIDFGLGVALSSWLSLGAGAHFAFSVNSEANMILQTSSNRSSSMRVTSKLKPKIGPYLGLLAVLGNESLSDPSGSLGLVFRFPVSSPTYYEIGTGARPIGGTAIVDFNLSATSVAQYDPLSIELGGSFKHGARGRLFLQVEYQHWEGYEKPAVEIEACKHRPCSINLSSSHNPHQPFHDIVIPKVGEEFRISPTVFLRAGYAYRPSTLKDQFGGSSNYLDPPKHILSTGAGFEFKHFLGLDATNRLDLHLSCHLLETQSIKKSHSTDIGSPGYTAGGKIFGGGLSLTLEI